MQEKNSGPGQTPRPGWLTLRPENAGKLRLLCARVTPVRAVGFVLVLVLLALSAASFVAAQNSQASAAAPLATGTPACLLTPTAGTATPLPAASPTSAGNRPTPTPTRKPTPTPTPTPTPSPSPTPSPTPTATPMPTATASPPPPPTMDAVRNFEEHTGRRSLLAPGDACTPTALASPTSTPVGTVTSTPAMVPGTTTGTSTPSQVSGGGGGMRVMLLVAGVSVLFLLCLGTGWFFFRRMLLPQAETRLPPSGASPWSRTRAPDNNVGRANRLDMDRFNQNVAQATRAPGSHYAPADFGQAGHGFGPPRHGFTAPPAYNYGAANPGLPASAPHSFVPPAQHGFPSHEASMIPHGSGAFPVVNNGGGFAPASSAFSAMYGLPGDPFSTSQAGPSSWLEQLGSNSNPGHLLPPDFASGPSAGLNDPSLPEAMRRSHQQSDPAQSRQPPETHTWFQNPDWLH